MPESTAARRRDLRQNQGVDPTKFPTRIVPTHAAPRPADVDLEDTTCPRCGESQDLAKVKGCIKCLKCSFKFDCNGW